MFSVKIVASVLSILFGCLGFCLCVGILYHCFWDPKGPKIVLGQDSIYKQFKNEHPERETTEDPARRDSRPPRPSGAEGTSATPRISVVEERKGHESVGEEDVPLFQTSQPTSPQTTGH